MPIGVLVNVVVVIIGGLLGGLVGKYLSTDFKEKLNMIFGACAMTMGISSICLIGFADGNDICLLSGSSRRVYCGAAARDIHAAFYACRCYLPYDEPVDDK